MRPVALPTPTYKIKEKLFLEYDLEVHLKREDLIHPLVSGNKWRKLKYNLTHAKETGVKRIVSFGGAYSNHVHALAYACQSYGLNLTLFIRGEEVKPMNPTLNDVKDWGAEVRYISRSSYKKRNDPDFLRGLTEEFSNSLVIPEGGTNKLAVQGLAEMIEELDRPYDNIAVPVGTGGTLSGSSLAIHDQASVLGYVVLKGAEEIDKDIKKLTHKENYVLYHEYHFGGYAKHTQDLVEFINSFKDRHGISLDPVYTGKMMFGFYNQVSKGMHNSKKIILIHTGGLQGVRGFNERFGNILD